MGSKHEAGVFDEMLEERNLHLNKIRVGFAVAFIAVVYSFIAATILLNFSSTRDVSIVGVFFATCAIIFCSYFVLGSSFFVASVLSGRIFLLKRGKLIFMNSLMWSCSASEIEEINRDDVDPRVLVFHLRGGIRKKLSTVMVREPADDVAAYVRRLIGMRGV